MSDEALEDAVQQPEQPEVIVQSTQPTVEPTVVAPVVVQKKKRPRSEKQIKALENARKNKAAKRNNKPVKVERSSSSSTEDTEYSFSWKKEIAKVTCLAALGLGSVFVQQQFAQNQKVVAAVDVPSVNEEDKPILKRAKTSVKDPFDGYR
jgi:hypothetical protein